MKLKVNRKNVTVFEGAEVRHAVLSYLALKGMDVRLADSRQYDGVRPLGT